MFRQLILPVLMAVVLVPDWASALGRRVRCGPPPVVYARPIPCPPLFAYPASPVTYQYAMPVGSTVVYPAVASADCPPAAATVEPRTPVIVPERMKEQPKVEPKKEVRLDPAAPAKEFATPTAAEPKVEPASAVSDKIPPLPVPMSVKPRADLPAFDVTPPLGAKPIDPLPPFDVPTPKADVPKADVPKADDKAKPSTLPKFDFAIPKADDLAQPVEANKPTVAKASPLSGERAAVVDVYPVDGPAPATPGAKRSVGFINKSSRDVLLTIDGQLVTLPARNLLRADLPAAFKWQIGGEKERQLTVPDTAPGVDVVIRN